MGLFDRSSSKSTNNTTNQTENFTETYNSALSGGDSEVGEGAVVMQHSNLSTVDNSLALSLSDNSYKDSSTRTSSTDNRDSSNNSFNLDLSGSDYSQKSDSTTNITTTDGGSFSMVSNIMGKMIESFSGTQNKLADLVGVSQKATLSATDDFLGRSADAQKQTAGVAELVSAENGKIKLIAGVAIAAAGLFAAYKFARGRK